MTGITSIPGASMFTAQDKLLFSRRGLSEVQQQTVESIYTGAQESVQQGKAQAYLLQLSPQALGLLQQASSLAEAIRATEISEEGAENLLQAPHAAVDLNNDGITEVGKANLVPFPPVNAPAAVKAAWDNATQNMDEGDRLTFSGMFLPVTLPGHDSNRLGEMASPGFDWKKLTDDMLYSNKMARPYNTPTMSDKIQSWLERFQHALSAQGLA